MNENNYWDEFYLSGSILSYLLYKKCQEEKDEGGDHECNKTERSCNR